MNERRLRGRAKQIVNWGKNTTTNEGCGCGKKEGEEEEAAGEKTNGCLALSLSLFCPSNSSLSAMVRA